MTDTRHESELEPRSSMSSEYPATPGASSEVTPGATTVWMTYADLQAVIDAKEGQLAAYRGQLDVLHDRLDAAERGAEEAAQEAETLRQAEAARQARGRWARLRAAWRGE